MTRARTTLQHVIPVTRFDEWRVKRDYSGTVCGAIKLTSAGLFTAHCGQQSETFDTIKKAQLWIERQAKVRQ